MKKLRTTLGVLVLILALSSMKISAVNIVPFGEITGKKTEPSTTEPEGTETLPSEENNGGETGTRGVKVIYTPPLFSRGRVETIFPVSYKVPEQWLGEFAYEDHGNPSMFYYPRLENFDRIALVLSYPIERANRTDEEFLRYIMDTIKEENDYESLRYKLIQGPDFPYARLSLVRNHENALTYQDRFYRVLEDQAILFQSLVFDEPDSHHVADTEAMFLSQYIDDTESRTPSTWKSLTHDKAVFRYPETWEFVEMDYTEDDVNGLMYLGEDGFTFLSVTEEYDAKHFTSDDDYFDGLESYAKWLADRYTDVEIVGVDVYLDSDITMRMRLFGTVAGERFEAQFFALLDTDNNRIYSLTLETYADPEGPNWEMIELFDTIVETFEVVDDPGVGQA